MKILNMRSAFIGLILLLGFSCAPIRFQKPLEKSEFAAGVNAGGPLIKFAGATIPIPFSSIYGGYGLTENTTAILGIHTTSLLFGNAQADINVLHQLYANEKGNFRISGQAGAMNLLDLNDNGAFRLYPTLAATALYEWSSGPSHRLYTGMDQWLDFYENKRVNPEKHNYWLPSIHLGYAHEAKQWTWGAELKYSGFHLSNQDIVVNYQTPFNTGNLGIYAFIHRRF